MTKLLIPGLTTVLDALNRHKKLRLSLEADTAQSTAS